MITDGESPLVTSDWEDTADKVNELEIYLTMMCVPYPTYLPCNALC